MLSGHSHNQVSNSRASTNNLDMVVGARVVVITTLLVCCVAESQRVHIMYTHVEHVRAIIQTDCAKHFEHDMA